MDQVGVRGPRGHRQVDRQRAERGERRLVAGERLPGAMAARRRSPHALRTVDVLEPSELAREVLDVHPRATVDLAAGTRG